MYKLLSLLFVIVSISTTSFTQGQNRKYEVKGRLSGFPDSTLIYLYEMNTHEADLIDSALLINNKFYFMGFLKDPINVKLQVKHSNNYKFFWIENSSITFIAEKNKFNDAVIMGSKTQDEEQQLDDAIKSSGKEKKLSILFIQNHPNSIISAYILSIYASTWGKDTSILLYRDLSKEIKNSSFGKNILTFITLNKNLKVEDRYVDFTEPNVEGKNISVSDFKGKVVLLDFWASWCINCRKENPELIKIYDKYNDKGFEILGVSADLDRKSWIDAINKDRLRWQNVTDLKGWDNKAAIIYGVSGYPTNYMIDRNGIIVAKDLSGDALRKKLDEMLINQD